MADVVFPEEGYDGMLLALIEGGVWHCHLYTNDPDVDTALTTEDFDEIEYEGYAPVPLKYWSPPATRYGASFSVHDPVFFLVEAGDDPAPARGYYVTHGPAGAVAWARRRPGDAYPLTVGGAPLMLLIQLNFPSAPAPA